MVDPARQLAANRRFLTEADVNAIESIIPTDNDSPLVIDLGSGSGTTALAVLGVSPGASIFSVDNVRANRDWAEANVEAYYPDAIIDYAVMSAVEFAKFWATEHDAKIDLLLHDASHRFEDVLADLKAWHPHLAPGTPVWVHDFGPPPLDWGARDESPEVRAALEELMLDGFLVETVGPVGLGWIGEIA